MPEDPVTDVPDSPVSESLSECPASVAMISLSGRDFGNCDLKYRCLPAMRAASRIKAEAEAIAAVFHFLSVY
jgi:hypothetical protein